MKKLLEAKLLPGIGIPSLNLILLIFLWSINTVAKDLHFKNAMDRSFGVFKNQSQTTSDRYIVQFKKNYQYSFRTLLEDRGAKFLNYVPDDAILVKASLQSIGLIESELQHLVSTVVAYTADLKLSDKLPKVSVFNEKQHFSYNIRVFNEAEINNLVKALEELDVDIDAISGRIVYVSGPLSTLFKVANLNQIEWLEPNPEVRSHFLDIKPEIINDPSKEKLATTSIFFDLTGYESGTKLMNLDRAYEKGFIGEGQYIAVADTGLDTGNLKTLHKDFSNVVGGQALGLFSNSWADIRGHGTHVAGSVGGTGALSEAKIRGAAWGAKMFVQGMWSVNLNALSTPRVSDLLLPAYKAGIRIHTNSWGDPNAIGIYDNMASSVDDFVWKYPDMLVLFAGGNDARDANSDGRVDNASIGSPATAKNIITVGASENLVSVGGIQAEQKLLSDSVVQWNVEPLASGTLSDNPNGIAVFSGRGPTKDKRLKPEVVAPGTNILSLRSQHPMASELWGAFNKEYTYSGGTSMSTPLVAGSAAIVREFLLKKKKIEKPSSALIKAILMSDAKDLFPGQYGLGLRQEMLTKRPNMHQGFGRIDMSQLIEHSSDNIWVDDKLGVGQNEDKLVARFTSRGREKISVLLTYTDAPALTSASKSLVNDLDLVIKSSFGTTFYGTDRVNNFEFFEGKFPAGTYEVYIRGHRIVEARSKQKLPFAVVINR